MVAEQRYNEILEHLNQAGSLTIRQISALLGVTRETIRRDLKHLSELGELTQVRGGALAIKQREPDIADRSDVNADGKNHIANIAKKFVTDGMSILMDSGSTALAISRGLEDFENLTIITNDFTIARIARCQKHKVIVLGGEMSQSDFGTCSIETIEAVKTYQVNIAFVGVGGLSEQALVTDYSQIAAYLRATMIKQAEQSFFVVDQTKFAKVTPIRVPDPNLATGIIVDKMPDKLIMERINEINLEVYN
ncbi:DeoR/GlpR family DNA-binding transcription regulator [Cohaesibacter gelatinilyticus]|uniref:Transcriptional regulator, DeoR family n=1 Tax=Cohaesibacter gelatinilyticus TaxID=372072 RepID=A0A285PGI1_9HYPH|nr:DeoR/GlpR family DNA-binding transcription regulator [Cohaesibacter gelatinilyticus]SNZ20403.1 transcriptional regulator, DeoR family [Cohaesibacter gelatinilyticus]